MKTRTFVCSSSNHSLVSTTRGLMLEGAVDGIKYYLHVDWNRSQQFGTWNVDTQNENICAQVARHGGLDRCCDTNILQVECLHCPALFVASVAVWGRGSGSTSPTPATTSSTTTATATASSPPQSTPPPASSRASSSSPTSATWRTPRTRTSRTWRTRWAVIGQDPGHRRAHL